jgi:hypothetical protein
MLILPLNVHQGWAYPHANFTFEYASRMSISPSSELVLSRLLFSKMTGSLNSQRQYLKHSAMHDATPQLSKALPSDRFARIPQ